MSTVKIETVELKINSGETAYITGIYTSSTECLVGYVHFPSGEPRQLSWDILGRARDLDSSFNLSPQSRETEEFDELKQTALHLVLPRIKNQLNFA